MHQKMLELHTKVTELQEDLETQQRRESQAMDFILKVTDKNILLLHENEGLRIKLTALENKQNPLVQTIEQSKTEIENLLSNILLERLKRAEENRIMSMFLAEQSYCNEKLISQVEDLKGQRIILEKKYNFILKQMIRETHLNHINTYNI